MESTESTEGAKWINWTNLHIQYFIYFSMSLFNFVTTKVRKKLKAHRYPAWMENQIYLIYVWLCMFIYVL